MVMGNSAQDKRGPNKQQSKQLHCKTDIATLLNWRRKNYSHLIHLQKQGSAEIESKGQSSKLMCHFYTDFSFTCNTGDRVSADQREGTSLGRAANTMP